MKAYPALLDRDGSVSLRLVDSPQRAEYETHFGLRRLCFLAAQRELKTQVDWLPNLDKMKLYTATLPGFDLREQLAELLADRAMVADQPVPRTKDDFERLLAAGRERIAWAVQELIALVGPIFEGYHQACLAIEEFCSTAGSRCGTTPDVLPSAERCRRRLAQAIGDRSRLRQTPHPAGNTPSTTSASRSRCLMEPQSFSKTPWDWLRQYPRYFRAICCRLENLPGGVPRDLREIPGVPAALAALPGASPASSVAGHLRPRVAAPALDARRIPRLAFRPKARHRDPRLAEAAGAAMGQAASVSSGLQAIILLP